MSDNKLENLCKEFLESSEGDFGAKFYSLLPHQNVSGFAWFQTDLTLDDYDFSITLTKYPLFKPKIKINVLRNSDGKVELLKEKKYSVR